MHRGTFDAAVLINTWMYVPCKFVCVCFELEAGVLGEVENGEEHTMAVALDSFMYVM